MADLSIPESGLSWLFPAWGGEGVLIRTLALLDEAALDEHWAQADVERRAARVLLGAFRAEVAIWPLTSMGWQVATPVVRHRHAEWTVRPAAKVDWARTRLRGWPPAEVFSTRRSRADEEVTSAVLGWVAVELAGAVSKAEETLDSWPAIMVARAFAPRASRPTHSDIQVLRSLNSPWPSVARVATDLLAATSPRGIRQLAHRLIHPDGVPDRIFQLAVLGECARSLAEAGCVVESLRPIDRLDAGPLYRVRGPDGTEWELWCEAGACWSAYGIAPAHRQLASGLRQADGPAFLPRAPRPDILLASPQAGVAVVIECKFPFETRDPAYISGGAAQGLYYAHQLSAVFARALVWVVGPEDLVVDSERGQLAGVEIAVGAPSHAAADMVHVVGNRFAASERAASNEAVTP